MTKACREKLVSYFIQTNATRHKTCLHELFVVSDYSAMYIDRRSRQFLKTTTVELVLLDDYVILVEKE